MSWQARQSHVVLVGEIVVLVRPPVAGVAARAARLVGRMEPQKLLAACCLPSFLPVVGLIASQVQCTLFITWCPASL